MKNRLFAGVLCCALSTVPAAAQDATPPPSPQSPPSCETAPYRAFDFWVGEWEVRTPGGRLAGRNSIRPINNGCALLESYSQGGSPAGQSYNFYDHVRGTWTQLWLSRGVIIRMEGPPVEQGRLDLVGTITYANQPEPRPFMGRWTLQEDGTVLQQFWERNPDTGEWGGWFEGVYSRVEE